MLVEAAVSPIHSAALGVLVGHNPVEAALGPTVLAVLVEAAVGPIHSAALVKTALGPPALAVLVGAALGPIAPPLALAHLASQASVWTPPRRYERQPGWRGIRRAG